MFLKLERSIILKLNNVSSSIKTPHHEEVAFKQKGTDKNSCTHINTMTRPGLGARPSEKEGRRKNKRL